MARVITAQSTPMACATRRSAALPAPPLLSLAVTLQIKGGWVITPPPDARTATPVPASTGWPVVVRTSVRPGRPAGLHPPPDGTPPPWLPVAAPVPRRCSVRRHQSPFPEPPWLARVCRGRHQSPAPHPAA